MMAPLTTLDRWNALAGALLVAVVVFGIATLLHFLISKNDRRKQIQGRPVRWWVAILFFVGACYGTWIADNRRYYLHEVVGGSGGFGLLIGLVLGNIHGAINLLRSRQASRESSDVSSTDSMETQSSESQNPFQPPGSL